MTEALLVCGGAAPPLEQIQHILKKTCFICAADSGLDTVQAWGLTPDLIVGDMDSLSDRSLLESCRSRGCEILEQSSYKDDTDTETALRELRRRGFGHIILAGGGGGRLDHILALQALFMRPESPAEWYTDRERIVKLSAARNITAGRGNLVSLFPLGPNGARGMQSRGLEWPLAGLDWPPGYFGISNICIDEEIWIDPGESPLLLIINCSGAR